MYLKRNIFRMMSSNGRWVYGESGFFQLEFAGYPRIVERTQREGAVHGDNFGGRREPVSRFDVARRRTGVMTHVPERAPDAPQIRFRVDPADVPPEKAARRLHLTLERFNELLPNLKRRGFPDPDQDTGMYDLDQIDLLRANRHRSSALTILPGNLQPAPQGQLDMGERFLVARRQTEGRRRHRGAA
jgi:hypothetical protein